MKSHSKIPRKSRGLSPVIATVILVSVTITVAIAVSYWMRGIAGQYTSFEKIELPVHYSQYVTDIDGAGAGGEGWNQTIELKNSGSKDATINNIFLNNIPLKDYSSIIVLSWIDTIGEHSIDLTADILISVTKGTQVKIVIGIPLLTDGCSSGTTIDLKITTAAGNQYPLLETLA
ncbi:hypothetical protein ES703_45520 [subsurface metagenome]